MRLRQIFNIAFFTLAAAVLLPAQAVDGSLRGLISSTSGAADARGG